MRRLQECIEAVDILVVHELQRQVVLSVLRLRVLPQIAQQAVILVGRELGEPHADLFLPLVAILGELGEKGPGIRIGTKQSLLNGKASRLFVFPNELVVGREDIGPVAGDDLVDLRCHFVLEQGAFEALVPFFRLDLALGVNLGGVSVGGDPGVDRGDALACYLGFLAEENHAESLSFHDC